MRKGVKTIPTIIIDEKTNVIIDGHHRLYVLKKLNILQVDVLVINYIEDENFIVVNPNKPKITKLDVIKAGLNDTIMAPKTTQHMISIYNKLYPIIVISKIIAI